MDKVKDQYRRYSGGHYMLRSNLFISRNAQHVYTCNITYEDKEVERSTI